MTIKIGNSAINDLYHAKSFMHLAVASERISMVNLINDMVVEFPQNHYAPVSCIHGLEDRIVCANDNVVSIWDATRATPTRTISVNHKGIKDRIRSVKLLNENIIVTGGSNCHIDLYDKRIGSNTPLYTLKVSTDDITCIRTQGNVVFASSNDNLILKVDLANDLISKFRFRLLITDFTIDGDTLVQLFESGDIGIFDYKTKALRNKYKAMNSLEYLIGCDFHDNHMICGSEKGKIVRFLYDAKINMFMSYREYSTESEIVNRVLFADNWIIGAGIGSIYKFDYFE